MKKRRDAFFGRDRRMLHFLFIAFGILSISAGCASRPGSEVLAPVSGARSANRLVTVYVASTRSWSTVEPTDRAAAEPVRLEFSAYTISLPPKHKRGEIEWPKGKPDPDRHFTVIERASLDPSAFLRKVREATAKDPAGIAGVYVHGYNSNFPESLFRAAQLSGDADFPGAPIVFDWPSRAQLSAYLADKEAATFSRDGLVDLLTLLISERGARRVAVLGHSMGGWLTMEALRQLRLTGRKSVLDKLQVTLAAPDIDIDVFRSQIATVGPLSPPLTILVASDDKALAFSRFLSGSRARLGALDVRDPLVQAAAARGNVEIVDISRLPTNGDGVNHSRYVQASALLYQLGSRNREGNSLNQAGAFVLNGVGGVLSSPFTIAGNALAAQ